jgi:hypothetical protein
LDKGGIEFQRRAKQSGLICLDSFDPTDPHDPNWKILMNGEFKERMQLQREFVERIAAEAVNSNNAKTAQVFAHWAMNIGRKEEYERAIAIRQKVSWLAIIANSQKDLKWPDFKHQDATVVDD